MRIAIVGLCLALLLPSTVHAAGFATKSLFLSKDLVTEGETVLIHAVVTNDAPSSFSGSLVFKNDSEKLGSVPVTLTNGAADTVSLPWKPRSGSHTITVELLRDTTVVEKQSATFAIRTAPVQTSTAASSNSAAVVESSDAIQEGIAGYSPATAAALSPVFTFIDGGRVKVADVVESQRKGAEERIGVGKTNAADILGAETIKEAPQNPLGALLFILTTIYFYVLTVCGFIISSAAVCYPVLAIIVLYILYRAVRRIRRRN